MSWFVGVWNSGHRQSRAWVTSGLHERPDIEVTGPSFSMAAGGIPETRHSRIAQDGSHEGWIVVGCGIQVQGSSAWLLTANDWDSLLQGSHHEVTARLHQLDGHFAVVRWDRAGLLLANDQLAQRTVYFSKIDTATMFCTRLSWLASLTAQHDIDFAAIGSRWLLYNQLSYGSCVRGIKRLGPGGSSFVPLHTHTHTHTYRGDTCKAMASRF